MKIAVLMSTYNGAKYLDAQLQSLAEQTVAGDMTLYIRDDGSRDDTFAIIEKWSSRMNIVLRKASNAGPALSFWELFMDEQIQADYYAFCDQDDVWDKDKLEQAVAALTQDNHLYCSNCRLIDGNGALLQAINQSEAPIITLPRLFVSGVVQGCAMVFTQELRRFIQSAKPTCIPMHDIVVMLYALGFGGIVWDRTPRFGYRVHGNNVVAKNNKSFLQKLRTTWWNWKNSSKNSMATVAQELLKSAGKLTPEDIAYLNWMRTYRKNPISKLRLLIYKGTACAFPGEKRSYKLRLLLNLL